MTVRELIRILETQPSNASVVVSVNTHYFMVVDLLCEFGTDTFSEKDYQELVVLWLSNKEV
jgi:hypothetical protein